MNFPPADSLLASRIEVRLSRGSSRSLDRREIVAIMRRMEAKTTLITRVPGLGPCWEWGGYTKSSYGSISVHDHQVYLHRLSYLILVGPLAEWALHRCDNPRCWRPDHLFDGTHTDNHADMTHKGRAVGPPRHRGQRHPAARHTDLEIAEAVRQVHAGANQHDVARQFGVSQSTIWRWVHQVVRT